MTDDIKKYRTAIAEAMAMFGQENENGTKIQPGAICEFPPPENPRDETDEVERLAIVLEERNIDGIDLLRISPIHFEGNLLSAGEVWLWTDETTAETEMAIEVWNTCDVKPPSALSVRWIANDEAMDKIWTMYNYLSGRRISDLPAGIVTGPQPLKDTPRGDFRESQAGLFADLSHEGWDEVRMVLGRPARKNDRVAEPPIAISKRNEERVEAVGRINENANHLTEKRVWLYRASANYASAKTTYDLARRSGYLWRSFYADTDPKQCVSNVKDIRPGDLLVLAYAKDGVPHLQGLFRVGAPLGAPNRPSVAGYAFVEIPSELHPLLTQNNYTVDSEIEKFVGLPLAHVCDLDGSIEDWNGRTNIRELYNSAVKQRKNTRPIKKPDLLKLISPFFADDVFAEGVLMSSQIDNPQVAPSTSPTTGKDEDSIQKKANQVRALVVQLLKECAATGNKLPIVIAINPATESSLPLADNPWSNLNDEVAKKDSRLWSHIQPRWTGTQLQFRTAIQVARELYYSEPEDAQTVDSHIEKLLNRVANAVELIKK